MSSALPSPNDDYVGTDETELTKAVWNAVFGSIGARLRALEGVQASFEDLIALGTGQALAAIAANIEPEILAARASLTQLQANTAAAEDVVTSILSGIFSMSSVTGLSAALAAKATPADIAAAIDTLKGGAPAAYDTLVEIAAALDADASALGTILAGITPAAILAKMITVDGAGSGLDADLVHGTTPTAFGLARIADVDSGAARLALGAQGKASLRNRHLNPGFRVCQDRAPGDEATMYACNGYAFDGVIVTSSGTMVLTAGRPSKPSPGGSPDRLRVGVSTAQAVLGSTDYASITFPIEGIDVSDLMFGTASAQPFVWRGIINRPAGTWGLAFRNATGTRSFVTTVVVSSGDAYTDKLVTVAVPGDTAGTWLKDASGAGVFVHLTLAAGSSYQTANADVWQAGGYLTTSAQTNGVGSTGNVFEVADIGLYNGTDVPAYELPDYADDLRRCSRLAQPIGEGWTGVEEATTYLSMTFRFAAMRAVPAIRLTSASVPARCMSPSTGTDRTLGGCAIAVVTASKRAAWVQLSHSGGGVDGRLMQCRDGNPVFFADARPS